MIGETLKSARANINVSQEELAKRLGVTKQTYMKWENNVTEPKASQIAQLSNLLQISADEICTGKLHKRYSLQDFMHRLKYLDDTTRTIRFWEELNDQEGFFIRTEKEFGELITENKNKEKELSNSAKVSE